MENAEREKKLAEVTTRWYKDPTLLSPVQDVARQAFHDVRFLLSELDDERSAHNEHAAELCKMESRLQSIQQERDDWINQYKRLETAAIALEIVISSSEQRAIDADKERMRLEQQVNTLKDSFERMRETYETEREFSGKFLKERDALVAQVNTLTEALKIIKNEPVRPLITYSVTIQNIATEALQSIKDTPREEQGE